MVSLNWGGYCAMCWKSECSDMLGVQDLFWCSLTICNQSVKEPVLKCRLAEYEGI